MKKHHVFFPNKMFAFTKAKTYVAELNCFAFLRQIIQILVLAFQNSVNLGQRNALQWEPVIHTQYVCVKFIKM